MRTRSSAATDQRMGGGLDAAERKRYGTRVANAQFTSGSDGTVSDAAAPKKKKPAATSLSRMDDDLTATQKRKLARARSRSRPRSRSRGKHGSEPGRLSRLGRAASPPLVRVMTPRVAAPAAVKKPRMPSEFVRRKSKVVGASTSPRAAAAAPSPVGKSDTGGGGGGGGGDHYDDDDGTAQDSDTADSDTENSGEEQNPSPRSERSGLLSRARPAKRDVVERTEEHKESPALKLALPACARIVAMGDVHGDIKYAKRGLRLLGLIAPGDAVVWTGGATILVQTGDQLDRARDLEGVSVNGEKEDDEDDEDDMEVLDFFDELDRQAQLAGGRVISLLGNHELYNCTGHMRYVSRQSLVRWKYISEARARAFQPGGVEARRLASTRAAFVIVGGWLFTHAGFTAASMKRLGITGRDSLAKFNAQIRRWLNDKPDASDDMPGEKIERLLSERVLGNLPPETFREGFVDGDAKEPPRPRRLTKRCRTILQNVLDTLKLKGIVIGHTVQENGITPACNNTVFRIDVGGSHAFTKFYDNPSAQPLPQVLEILNDSYVRRISEDATLAAESRAR